MNHKLWIALSRVDSWSQENDLFLLSLCLAFFFLFLRSFRCIGLILIILHWRWSYVVCSPSTSLSFSIVLIRRSCLLDYWWCCTWESLRPIILTRWHLGAWSWSRILLPVRVSSTLRPFVSCCISSRCTRLHYDVIPAYIISNGENVARISGDCLAELLYLKYIIEVLFGVARL